MTVRHSICDRPSSLAAGKRSKASNRAAPWRVLSDAGQRRVMANRQSKTEAQLEAQQTRWLWDRQSRRCQKHI